LEIGDFSLASYRAKKIYMLIDAHLHLDKYGDLLDEALKQIETERIFTVATAMDVPSYLEMRTIGERCELVLPTFGIHPRRAADHASRLPELGRNIETSLTKNIWNFGSKRDRKNCASRKDAKRAKFGLVPFLQRGTKGDFAIRKISPCPSFPKRGRRGSWRLGAKNFLEVILLNILTFRI
jgi:TatD related DNase